MLALALQHDEIDDDEEIAIDLLALAELEHVRTQPANDPRYPHARTLALAPPRPTRVPAPILYEEFHPHGSSAYRAVSSGIEVSAKRYRYTGKERDEETGLDHMGARYYAGWLGRWTAADPIGLGDGVNRYAYVRGNPVRMRDPSGTLTEPPTMEDLRRTHAEWNAEVDAERGRTDQKPKPDTTEKEPDRQSGKPYSPDTSGKERFEKQQAEYQEAGGRRYETGRRVEQGVREAMDRGALWTAAYAGALFGPAAYAAVEGLGGTALGVRAFLASERLVQGVGALPGGKYALAFLATAGAAASAASGEPLAPSLPGGKGPRLPGGGGGGRGGGGGGGGARRFFSGTDLESAEDIAANGLNAEKARAGAQRGVYAEPGSFFTVEADQPGSRQLAYEFGLRKSDTPVVLELELSGQVAKQVEAVEGGVRVSELKGSGGTAGGPNFDETVFRESTFSIINEAVERGEALFRIIFP